MGRKRKLPKLAWPPVQLQIEGITQDGRGVGALEGKTVFVSGALPGEFVEAEITRSHRTFNEAETRRVITSSSERVDARCASFGICGGCNLQHMHPHAQIMAKQQVLKDALQRIGQVQPKQWLNPITGPAWGYRRKARLGVRDVQKKGRVLIGFRERAGRLLADIECCEILVPEVGWHLSEMARLIESLDARKVIPQIEVIGGDESICLTIRHLQPLSEADQRRLIEFSHKSSLWIAVQPGGPETITPLWPEKQEMFYSLPDFEVRIYFQAGDFIQVNAQVNRCVVAEAMRLLDLSSDDTVLELYSGLGNFTLPMLRLGAGVTALEGDARMTLRAARNAQLHGLTQVEHLTINLLEPNPEAPWLHNRYSRLLLDPPRSGAREMLPYIAKIGPQRILYISCEPATLARDVGELVRRYGYRLEAARVIDMFPHTTHVESMALLHV